MKIQITNEAAQWFEKEMLYNERGFIRFFVRYGGSSPIQEGFSLGVNTEAPIEPGATYDTGGNTYYIEEKDLWYFKDHNLLVDYDEQTDGPIYIYKQ